MFRKRHLSTANDLEFSSEARRALVIGNSKYKKRPLINPMHDSEDIATLLKSLYFDVQLLQDANWFEMMQAVDEFKNNLSQGGVGLFYFAGHGVQVKGINYLIPIDARIEKELHIQHEAVDVSFVLESMDEARSRVKLVILDACRDNPFENFRS